MLVPGRDPFEDWAEFQKGASLLHLPVDQVAVEYTGKEFGFGIQEAEALALLRPSCVTLCM